MAPVMTTPLEIVLEHPVEIDGVTHGKLTVSDFDALMGFRTNLRSKSSDRWRCASMSHAKCGANTAGTVSAAASAAAAAYGAAGGGSNGTNGSIAPHQNPSDATNYAGRNNILIKSSTINLRSEDFLKQQSPQAPASQAPGPGVPHP